MNPVLIVEGTAFRLSESGTMETLKIGNILLGEFQATAPESRNMTGGQDDAIKSWLEQATFAFPSNRKSQVQDRQMKGKVAPKEKILPREHGIGAVSKYLCTTCLKSIITVDRDEGTTWPQLNCTLTKHCPGRLRPQAYQGKDEPQFEWRLPTDDEIRLSGEGTVEYEYLSKQAGLIMVPYSGVRIPRRKQAAVQEAPKTEKPLKVMPSRRAKLGLEV